MSENQRARDPWALPTLGLWLIFFLIGLFPDWAFRTLRDLGGVVTMRAYVNSPNVITIAFTIFLSVFVFLRCKANGLTDAQAQGRAVQAGLMAIVAFLWQPLGMLALSDEIIAPRFQRAVFTMVIWSTAFVKMLSWLYLLSLFLRYYAFGKERVFATMPCVFPSAYVPAEDESQGEYKPAPLLDRFSENTPQPPAAPAPPDVPDAPVDPVNDPLRR